MPGNYEALRVSQGRMVVLTKAERFVLVDVYLSGGLINERLAEIYETL